MRHGRLRDRGRTLLQGPAAYIAKHGSYQNSEPRFIARVDAAERLVEYAEKRGKRTPVLHEVQVKVCAGCNTGWMSRMEMDIAPLVRRLTEGPGGAVDPDEQRRLSTWVHKTFLMYDLYEEREDRRYRPPDYTGLVETGAPVGDIQIYLAAADSPFANFGMWSDSRVLVPGRVDAMAYATSHPPNCGTSYFAVDGVVLIEHWFSPDYPGMDPAARFVRWRGNRTPERLGMKRIWPASGLPIDWPPTVLSTRTLHRARLSLFNALRFMPVVAERVPPPCPESAHE